MRVGGVWRGGNLAAGLLAVAGVEMLVLTFFYRPVVSLGLLIIVCWMHLLCKGSVRRSVPAAYLLSGVLLAFFPIFDVVGKSKSSTMV